MSFQLPSAASRSMVSILNDGQESQSHRNLPVISNVSCESPKEQSPASRPTTLPPTKLNDVMNNSYSSVSSSGTQSSNSGQSTDATSPEPSPQPSEQRLKERLTVDRDELLNVPGIAVTSLPTMEPSASASASTTLLHEDMDTSPDHSSFSSLERSASLPSSSLARQQSVTNSSGSSSPSGSKKRYPCSHPGCDKTFSTSGHAARHNRIHTGTKPYRCMFPGCKATFSRQDNALAHFRTGHALTKQRMGEIEDSQDGADGAAVVRGSLADPEQQAAIQLGRKALEEGTAIAVVREGRVERTVGLPHAPKRMGLNLRETKSSEALMTPDIEVRESSASTTHEQTGLRPGHTPASEYAQSRSSATFANADARQRAYAAQDMRSYHGGPASVSSNSSGNSSRVHPYHAAIPLSHRKSIPNLQDQGPGGPAKLATSTSEHSPASIGSLPLQPPRHAVHNCDVAKPSAAHSVSSMSALPASSSGFRRGSGALSGAGPILPPPVASFHHHYPPAPSSSSGSSVSSTSSLRGHWSSLRLDSVGSNMRAQRMLPAWNSSSSSQQSLQHRNSLTDSLRDASASSRHGELEGGASISPPSTRPHSAASSSQSPYIATTASALSYLPEAEQQSTRKIQLPLSSDRTGATGGGYNVSAMRRSPDSSDPLRLPPLKLPA